MRKFTLVLVMGMRAASAFAQHEGHTTTDAAAEAATAAEQPVNDAAAADPHAGHVMPAAEPAVEVDAAVDPHAGHVMPAAEPVGEEDAAADPHAGHVMPAAEPVTAEGAAQEHAGHDPATMSEAVNLAPETAVPPEAFSGPLHAADTIFGSALMAGMREQLLDEHGNIRAWWLNADQIETRIRDGGEKGYLWDAQGWYGGDINKLWLKSEGEGDYHESPDHAEVQALWSHAIAPWWDFQAGVRHDFRPASGRTHLALGLQGLMPYQFETDAAIFLSDDGDASARLETEYDLRITQRLILQPRLELDISGADIPELGIGSGVSAAEIGVRLRYEFAREFAPYLGVEYARSFGDTADYARASGENAGGWSFLVGIRTWF